MHSAAFVVALLLSTSHARRVQSLIKQLKAGAFVESQEPIKTRGEIVGSASSRYAGAKARTPLEDLARFCLARVPEAAFHPTIGSPAAVSQLSHCRVCQFPSRSRAVYLTEHKKMSKKTTQQKALDDIQEAMKAYPQKEEVISGEEDGDSRRNALGSLGKQAVAAVFGCILGAGLVLGIPKRDEKIKSELIELKAILKEQEAKLRQQQDLATSAGASTKAKLNNKDALQQRLQETEAQLKDAQAVWRSAVAAAASAEQDSKRKATLSFGLALFAAVEGFVLLRGKEEAEAAIQELEAKELANKATLEKAAAIVAAELEAVEEANEAALEEAAAELQAATLSKEEALQKASVEATAKLEAAMREVAAARAEAAEKKGALQEARAQIQEAQQSAAKQVQAVEATKEAALKEAMEKMMEVQATEAARKAAVKVPKHRKLRRVSAALATQVKSVENEKESAHLQSAATTVMQELLVKQTKEAALKKADAAAEAKLAAANEKVTEAQAKAAEAEAALQTVKSRYQHGVTYRTRANRLEN